MLRIHNPRLLDYLRHRYQPEDLRRLIAFLRGEKTFHFPALSTGLYPAAHLAEGDSSGYASVWVRDNVHVAHAHLIDGQHEIARKIVVGLVSFFGTQRKRIADVLAGVADPSDPMLRPHIRFDGKLLAEIDQKWAHAQNDALGYFLWIATRLIEEGLLTVDAATAQALAGTALFLEKIEFWRDEDSGHWEESRKQSSSSIGTALAGLQGLLSLVERPDWSPMLKFGEEVLTRTRLEKLVAKGREALTIHLPHECADADTAKRREADGALLFLVYPLEIVDEKASLAIIESVVRELQGDIGIRRYKGDSYWCADYKTKLSSDMWTADFSDDMSGRDAMLRAGEEAQWCIFDPILSAAYGRRFQATKDHKMLALQTEYLNRSLGHLTADDSRFGGMRCPESYYLENGRYVPVDQTPLLWTQGNLLTALRMMERSLELQSVGNAGN
ncbi:MAG: glycoside hydrolase family 15 protein [Planctomycetia bacterium]|nr:glycoside hydrolase family 15 protein [Planctomycetia bacterium]